MDLMQQILGAVMAGQQQGGASPPDAASGGQQGGGLLGALLLVVLGMLARPGSGGALGGGLGGLLGALAGAGGAAAAGQGAGTGGPAGLAGLLEQFQRAGLGAQAQSWVSTGQNLPVSADDIVKALGGTGGGMLGEIAKRAGVSEAEASGGLARLLPEVVNQLTPQGQLPDETALSSMIGLFRR